MRLFRCQACDQVLYFENTRCEKSGNVLGFLPEIGLLSALEPAQGDLWQPLVRPDRQQAFCANAAWQACNWMVPSEEEGGFCLACRHNRTIPDLNIAANLPPWRKWQDAIHRLIYTLRRLRLPLKTRAEDPEHGLTFDVMADPVDGGPKVMTGHDNGVITFALAEADDAEREARRAAMGEPFRTLLGHVRHETGHHFWDLLVRDGGKLEACRAVFGDDSQDYGAALQRHYNEGPPPDWQNAYVSTYATAHPWEDFAETWAHYLHIVDTLEMAASFGLKVAPKVARTDDLDAEIDFDPYKVESIQTLVEAWLPLTFAVNSLNRCMGSADLYPFVLSPPAIRKLGFVHDLIRGVRAAA
ncbi:zinc-binding metallopeptidase family protein [Paracraurococcus lichenis]|uniref:Zinc-binding peptidase n=1 Tax=Paracraurococcus lichenis TaxID=3064888 RepID=A0ABT9E273_9PROT|nr:putative zinc-binding peptidase [Paracraurococcus sp. LOR1-02]MDO9710130.1 putative zinc-binding peptidase [Paracraurococcus sp. LOR1-02]